MNVYIDKANLKSYVLSSANPAFSDCNRMLANKFDINFTFSKEEIADDVTILEWIKIMNDGFQGKITWNVNHPQRPIKSNSHVSFSPEQLSSVYLVDDDRIEKIKEYGLLLFGGVGSEVNILSSLVIVGSDYGFVKQMPIRQLTHWDNLRKYTSPCTDIILVDRYLFTFEELYKENVYSLIGEICSHAKDAKMNIVILTLPKCYDKRSKRNFVPNWADIRKNIKSTVKEKTGENPNVTLILSSNLKEHDRTIFTNYKSIESGDSFNYFDSNKNVITSGRHIEVFSLVERDFYTNNMQFVSDMQKILDNTKRLNIDNIIGDKKSNYLKF